MRISDWSSDVCSSDLGDRRHVPRDTVAAPCERNLEQALADWLRQPSGRARPAGRSGQEYWVKAIQIGQAARLAPAPRRRSEEHTSELQSLMRITYAVFCLKKKTETPTQQKTTIS